MKYNASDIYHVTKNTSYSVISLGCLNTNILKAIVYHILGFYVTMYPLNSEKVYQLISKDILSWAEAGKPSK